MIIKRVKKWTDNCIVQYKRSVENSLNLRQYLFPPHTSCSLMEEQILFHSFLTWALEESGQLQAPAPLPALNKPHYPVNGRWCGPHNWSGPFKKRKISRPNREPSPGSSSWYPSHCTYF